MLRFVSRKEVEKKSVNVAETYEESDEYDLHIHSIGVNRSEDWFEEAKVDNNTLKLKLDTGAQCNVINLGFATKVNAKIIKSE